MPHKLYSNEKGFSLIELLVVTGIMGIVALGFMTMMTPIAAALVLMT